MSAVTSETGEKLVITFVFETYLAGFLTYGSELLFKLLGHCLAPVPHQLRVYQLEEELRVIS